MEEAPGYVVNDANEIEHENPYWGPFIIIHYLQYSEGQWKIVETIYSSLDEPATTETP
jgi:hypothetical protein